MRTNIFRGMFLTFMSLALTIGVLSSVPAATADDPTYTLTGHIIPTAEFTPLAIGLCAAACITTQSGPDALSTPYQASFAGTTDFTLTGVPYGDYAPAVVYNTVKNGQTVDGSGYLKYSNFCSCYLVVSDYSRADKWTVDSDVAIGDMRVKIESVPPPPPPAPDPEPFAKGRFSSRGAGASFLGGTFRVYNKMRGYHFSRNMTGRVVMLGCGGHVIAKKVIKHRFGSFKFIVASGDNPRLPPTLLTKISVAQPHHRTFHFTFRNSTRGIVPTAC